MGRFSRIAAVGLFCVTASATVYSTTAEAGPYTAEYVFGDSLSDNGNLAEALGFGNFPNPPSYHDSFTNGPVGAAVLASRLGFNLNPSLWVTGFQDIHGYFGGASYAGGTNYAVAGATSAFQAVGGPASINLPQQVAAYNFISGSHADPNALYFVLIGGNDVRNAALQGTGATAIATGVQTEAAAIQLLINEGARNLLVVNVPNVGVIPEFTQDNPTMAAAATTDSQLYDSELATALMALTKPTGTNLTTFDLYAYNAAIIANASAYGITNTTDRCFTSTPYSAAATAACGVNGANIGSYFYWDSIHPTAQVQALAGYGFAAALGVPEPGTIALVAIGVVGLAAGSRRRRAAGA